MAARRPLILVSGTVRELPAGDAIPAAPNVASLPTASAAYDGVLVEFGGALYRCDGSDWLPVATGGAGPSWSYFPAGF